MRGHIARRFEGEPNVRGHIARRFEGEPKVRGHIAAAFEGDPKMRGWCAHTHQAMARVPTHLPDACQGARHVPGPIART